jgi:DNA repair exonuclease SbcCD ATPase subunit
LSTALTANYENRLGSCQAYLNSETAELNRRSGRQEALEDQLQEKEHDLELNRRTADVSLKVRILMEKMTEDKREAVRTKIEALVTHGIQAVFGEGYFFVIKQELKRNAINFDFKIIHEFGGERHESDLRGTHGGGLVALVGFLLRVVMVLFSHPTRRRTIFLDETMAALDGDKRVAFAHLLRTLGGKLGLQFVLITHSPEYSADADKVYEVLAKGDGKAKIVAR